MVGRTDQAGIFRGATMTAVWFGNCPVEAKLRACGQCDQAETTVDERLAVHDRNNS